MHDCMWFPSTNDRNLVFRTGISATTGVVLPQVPSASSPGPHVVTKEQRGLSVSPFWNTSATMTPNRDFVVGDVS